MTTRAFYHPRNLVVDLADLTIGMYDEIAGLHGQIDPPPAAPVLTCLGNGEPMYVYRHESGRYFVRHFPHGNNDGHGHAAIARMSDEHRRQAEYSRRAADRAGFTAALEVSTGNGTRLDVGVIDRHIGFEIQRSQLSLPSATSRARKSFEAGWPTAWISDSERDPAWADRVPTARLTSRGWDVGLPDPNSAYVSIATFRRERDTSRASGWWYRREPRAVLLDELAALMPAGDIVAVAVGTRGHVVLAERAAADVIDSCTYAGASVWNPVKPAVQVKETVQNYSRDCHHPELSGGGFPTPDTRALLTGPATCPVVADLPQPGLGSQQQGERADLPPSEPIQASGLGDSADLTCTVCHQMLLHPVSITRGICHHCIRAVEPRTLRPGATA